MPTFVYRGGKWDLVPGEALVPGDVVSLARPGGSGPTAEEKFVPADCLLLSGSCIVEEALLTGKRVGPCRPIKHTKYINKPLVDERLAPLFTPA